MISQENQKLRHRFCLGEEVSGVAFEGWPGSRSVSGSSPNHHEKVERGPVAGEVPRYFQMLPGCP